MQTLDFLEGSDKGNAAQRSFAAWRSQRPGLSLGKPHSKSLARSLARSLSLADLCLASPPESRRSSCEVLLHGVGRLRFFSLSGFSGKSGQQNRFSRFPSLDLKSGRLCWFPRLFPLSVSLVGSKGNGGRRNPSEEIKESRPPPNLAALAFITSLFFFRVWRCQKKRKG